MAIINNLKETRLQRHVEQQELAKATGFSIRTVSRVECGDQNPSAEFMLRVANFFELLVEDIFSIEE